MKSASSLVKYNDRLSQVYDTFTVGQRNWAAPRACFRLLRGRIPPEARILDLGIGTGQSSEPFYQDGYRVVGMDISRGMLAQARKRLPKAQLVQGDIERPLPFPNGTQFDLVLAVGVLEFVENLPAVLNGISLVLRKSGLFCLTYEERISSSPVQRRPRSPLGEGARGRTAQILSFPVYRRTPREIRHTLTSQSFQILKQSEFTAYHRMNPRSGRQCSIVYRAVLAQPSPKS